MKGLPEHCLSLLHREYDLFYYVKISDGRIDDIQMSSPSLLNIDAFRKSMAGNIFTDYHFNWESFGIWISELAVVMQ